MLWFVVLVLAMSWLLLLATGLVGGWAHALLVAAVLLALAALLDYRRRVEGY